VDRPAAPITTFLLGYAVAKAGDGTLQEAAQTLQRLSGEWDLGLHRA
jgi:exonuclease VII small subunit